LGRKLCISGWKTMPLIKHLWMMVVISCHKLLSNPMPWTLPGLVLGISTRMLQCRRVGKVPVQKMSWTKSVMRVQGRGSCLCWLHQVLRSSMLMPLGPCALESEAMDGICNFIVIRDIIRNIKLVVSANRIAFGGSSLT